MAPLHNLALSGGLLLKCGLVWVKRYFFNFKIGFGSFLAIFKDNLALFREFDRATLVKLPHTFKVCLQCHHKYFINTIDFASVARA